ncbi:MAG: hypothetical protein H0X67_22855 [Acidobacteria bacterium]|nr:hypothetical protein [Acidobacteriota bacterium]
MTSSQTPLSGQWRVEIAYAAGQGIHVLHLQQHENDLVGSHQGDFISRDIAGTVNGDTLSLASIVTERHGDSLNNRFTGRIDGDEMSGSLNMGEYRTATWSARRHVYGRS